MPDYVARLGEKRFYQNLRGEFSRYSRIGKIRKLDQTSHDGKYKQISDF